MLQATGLRHSPAGDGRLPKSPGFSRFPLRKRGRSRPVRQSLEAARSNCSRNDTAVTKCIRVEREMATNEPVSPAYRLRKNSPARANEGHGLSPAAPYATKRASAPAEKVAAGWVRAE
jgi:hypothetical protein